MISDEEKEALEILKGFEPDDLVECAIYLQALEKITNLIKKQSKEIQLLKEQKQYVIDEYGETIEKQSKEIEELKEDNKNLEDELNKYIVKMSDEQYRRLVDIIRDEINKLWEDKIKAKIEELNNPESEFFKSLFNTNEPTWTVTIQRVLQSLLEKE